MTNKAEDIALILARLERLERVNRRMRAAALVCLICALCLLAMGQAKTSSTIQAERFIVVDSNGLKRAELGTERAGPALTLFDTGGKSATDLLYSDLLHMSWLSMGAGENNAQAQLSVLPGNAELVLWGPYRRGEKDWGETVIEGVKVKLGPPRSNAEISVDEKTANIEIMDPDKFMAILGTAKLMTPQTGASTKTSAASLKLFDKDGKLLWSAP